MVEEVIKERTPGIFEHSFSLLIRKNEGYTVVSRSLHLALLPHTPTVPANPLNYQCMQEILQFRTGLSSDDYIYFRELSNTDRSFNVALGKGVLQTPQLVLYKPSVRYQILFHFRMCKFESCEEGHPLNNRMVRFSHFWL